MRKIQANDIDICYEIKGSGPRLLYINGTGGDLRKAPSVFDSPLTAHFEVLCFDQRGMGRTSKPDIPYSMTDYANDVAALLDALGWGPVPVVGYSFGGMVAQEFTLRYPEKVTLLALICTSSGGEGGSSYPLHQLQDMAPQEKVALTMELSDSRQNAQWRHDNSKFFILLRDMVLESNAIGTNEPNHQIGEQRQLEARISHDTWGRLSEIKSPVLLLAGEYDNLCPVDNMMNIHHKLTENNIRSEIKIFKGGHQCMLQDRAAYPWLVKKIGENH